MARPEKDIDSFLLLKRYEEGYSSRQIGREFGLSGTAVMKRINKLANVETHIKRTIKLK